MTVYCQCWGQINSTHCTAPLMYARYVFAWMMCCSMLTLQCQHVWVCWESLGPNVYSTQPGSQFLLAWASVPLCHDSPERPIACLSSRRGHSRFWCYGDRHSVHGLTLSVIWPPVLITVSGALISEHNGLSQFSEDTGKPSVPVWEYNLIAHPLA